MAVFSLFVAACGGGGASGSGNGTSGDGSDGLSGLIDIKGSDTMVNLGQAWAEDFMDLHPNVQISVTGGGSGTGVAQLINDNADIAQMSRAMKAEEFQAAADNNVTAYEFVVGQDGLALAVHADSPVYELTIEQIKGIYTGAITHWSELGWADGGAITVYSRDSNSGTYVYFQNNVIDGDDWADGTRFMPGSASINEALQTDRSGIGYYGVGYLENVQEVLVSEDGGQNFYSPLNEEDVNEGRYPIARPLHFYTNGTPAGTLLEYLKWVLSKDGGQGDPIVRTGFFPINAEQRAANDRTFQEAGVQQ